MSRSPQVVRAKMVLMDRRRELGQSGRKPTAVSLFAGVGGFDLGAELAGFEVIGQVEIDKNCQEVLRQRFPNALLHDDVTTAIAWAKENDLIGRVDIVCGGFPCQDVSVAGKRAGIAGARSGLFWEAIRFSEEVQAHTIILENVPGLLSSNNGRDFGVVISTLADAGYSHIEWRVLDSQFFGVPQRRRRVFIVGTTRNPSGSPILVEREGLSGDSQQSEQEGQDPSASSGGSTVARMRGFGDYAIDDKASALKARDYKDVTDIVVLRRREGKPGGGKGPLLSNDRSLSLGGVNDQSVFIIPIHDKATRFAGKRKLHTGEYSLDGAGNGLGIGKEGDPMNTLTQGDRHAVAYDELNNSISDIHHTLRAGTKQSTGVLTSVVRRLTPLECERLQGFPDNWTESQPLTQRYKQMGNAVTVNVAKWIFDRITDTIDLQ